MTVTNETNKVRLVANGSATDFDFDFKIFADTDLSVYTIVRATDVETLKTINVDYTVSFDEDVEGGTVTFTSPPADTLDVFILREYPLTQPTDLPTEGSFREDQVEDEFDRIMMIIQQLQEQIDRAALVDQFSGSSASVPTFPNADTGKALKWAADGSLTNSIYNVDDILADALAAQTAVEAAQAAAEAAAASVNAVGLIGFFSSETPPTSWLACDGSSVSRTTYSELFAVIGTAYGTASGTTFNLPDGRGKFPRGWDNGAGNDPDAGSRTAQATGGATGDNVGSIQADELKAHTHDFYYNSNQNIASTPDPTATVNGPQDTATTSTGGNETRPINFSGMWMIKYQ